MNKTIVYLMMALVLCSFVLAHSYQPINYYTFDSDLTDNGLERSDLDTIVGTPQYRTAIIGNGAYFDEGAEVLNSSMANLSIIHTLDGWFRLSKSVADDFYLEFSDGGANNRIQMTHQTSLEWNLKGTDYGETSVNILNPPIINDWLHLVVVMNDTGKTVAYINGTEVLSDSSMQDLTAAYTQFGLNRDYDGGRGGNVTWDNLALFEERYTPEDVTYSFNSGAGVDFSTPEVGEIEVNLLTPTNQTISNSLLQNLTYNVTIDTEYDLSSCSLYLNTSGIWGLNTTDNFPTNDTTNTFQDIELTEGDWLWNVECQDAGGNTSFAENFTLKIDQTDPIITPADELLNNATISINNTLDTNISFSDDNEIYSINITLGNGTQLYGVENLGQATIQVNISEIINEVGTLNLTARVCDAHTANQISTIEYKEEDSGLKYVMDKFLIFDSEWVKIYPKDSSLYATPNTAKRTDRYPFTFNKKSAPSTEETFIVESSHKIDIDKKQLYSGHLIIPEIGDNGYWIDFENGEAKSYKITRINDKKVEVTITGLKSQRIDFNSIGELNCISETYYFNNLAPQIEQYTTAIVRDTFPLSLYVTQSDIITSDINTTLVYNSTNYYGGVVNSSVNITAPSSISTNSTNISYYWILNINGTNHTLDLYNQSLYDFNLDNCSDYSQIGINFTYLDEKNTSQIQADAIGVFNYSYNNLNKSYSLTDAQKNSSLICIYPNNITLTGNYYMFYEGSNYPQRRYYDNSFTANNITQDINLYLLNLVDGIYGRFRIVDSYENALSGVTGKMKRTIGSSTSTLEQQNSDDSGLMTFWLNPDVDYQFIFSKTGYTTLDTTLRVTTTEIYTVTLGGGTTTSINESYASGVSYTFSPNGNLANNTAYDFTYSMSSSYWTITDCTLYLKNQTHILNSSSSSFDDDSCDITINYNTASQPLIISEVSYTLNNSNPINSSRQYDVLDLYEGQFSLKNFLDDLKDFGDAGFNDFTRTIIAFIIIMGILAAVSIKLTVHDPQALTALAIVLVWAFSYIDWLNLNQVGLSGFLARYMIAILVTMLGASYIIKEQVSG